ncbi:hypothetical protein CcaCcLH18_04701 [Colletotrichum camelliae]|nr:hypothetical protein CcaCcLH18_04701 [Colletotrichum camelliae]
MHELKYRWNGYDQEEYWASDSTDSYDSDEELAESIESSVKRELAERHAKHMNMTAAKRRLGETAIKTPDDCSPDLDSLMLNPSPDDGTNNEESIDPEERDRREYAAWTARIPIEKDFNGRTARQRLKSTAIDKSGNFGSDVDGHSAKPSPEHDAAAAAAADKKSTKQDQVEGLCTICRKKRTSRKCALCNDGWICSLRCQESFVLVGGHFAGPLSSCADHFNECVLNPKTTASLLYIFAAADWLPRRTENYPEMYQRVMKDYRFDTFDDSLNKDCLLNFYRQVIYQLDVSAREIHLWREEGKLFERIAVLCQSYPKTIGDLDLRWFKETPLWESELSSRARATIGLVVARKGLEYVMDEEEWTKYD